MEGPERLSAFVARILIVDDNLMIRTLLRDILTSAGHEVVGEARDGLEAPTLLHEHRPDLVLLDLVMPGRDGLTTLNHMRMIDPMLVVIVCSASLDQKKVIRALQLGAKGFIVKPFNRDSVLAAVQDVLRSVDGQMKFAVQAHGSLPAERPPEEKREFARVGVSLAVTVRPSGGAVEFGTRTLDLSGSGMLLASGSLDTGTRLAFRLDLGGGEEPLEGSARVVRVTPDGQPALQFLEMSVSDHERLNAYVAEVQGLAPAARAVA
jgi:two-component system, chemotaxis family, chemotaxis protein CheY